MLNAGDAAENLIIYIVLNCTTVVTVDDTNVLNLLHHTLKPQSQPAVLPLHVLSTAKNVKELTGHAGFSCEILSPQTVRKHVRWILIMHKKLYDF